MKILRLTAENVKRIKIVEIEPDGNLVVIGGRNGQGKTSVLDSITYALAGKTTHPTRPIRDGEDNAKIVCELDDLIVTRTFTQKGGTLVVSNKEGAKYPTPQAMLDKLTGKLGFDPLAFSRMLKKEQLETLKSLVGLDFSELDARRKGLYEQRTLVNREGKELKAVFDQMPEYPDVPESEISVSLLMEELERREEHNRANMAKRTVLDQLNGEVAKQTEKVAQLEKELEEARTELEKVSKAQNEFKVEVDALHDTDEQEIREQVAGAETINKKVSANRERSQILPKLRKKSGEYKKLTSQIEDIDKAKSDALASASFPVSYLSFDEDGVLFNGLPFDQASSAEQLRVSVAIGLAMNPELKVLLIRDGSLLDKESLQMIASLAADANAQVWIERVGEGDEVSIIIEDGMIKDVFVPQM